VTEEVYKKQSPAFVA